MSMDFSEFRRLLGAEPGSRDPSFLNARDSSPEFRAAADEADRFEQQLERALNLEIPDDLIERIRVIPRPATGSNKSRRIHRPAWRFAMAAGLLMAVGAAGLTWRMNAGWDSVEEYVADHYGHDGLRVLSRADDRMADDVGAVLAEFGMTASPRLAGVVDVIKTCPTPDGKGVHMVLNTERGLVTVIYMPATAVTDGEHIRFDDREAVLVALRSGSAAIIGSESQHVAALQSMVQESILPTSEST